jgi:hypothetical protein
MAVDHREVTRLARVYGAWASGEPLPDDEGLPLSSAEAAAAADRIISDNRDLPSLGGDA